jgi:hypothetical protein
MEEKYVTAWVRRKRTPSFIGGRPPLATFGLTHYLRGNMPVLDILKLTDNEGLDYSRDLAMLFAASGDCRNLIKSIAGLPDTYSGEVTAILNDRNIAVVARNVMILLAALHFDADTAVSVIIHLWYPALIPHVLLDALQKEILPHIEHVCGKVKTKSQDSIQAKTFTFSKGSLRVVLRQREGFQLAAFFEVPTGLTCRSANTLRKDTMLQKSRRTTWTARSTHGPKEKDWEG